MISNFDPVTRLNDLFTGAGFSYSFSNFFSISIIFIATVLFSWLANLATKTIIRFTVSKVAKRSHLLWPSVMHKHKVFTRLSHFVPAIIIWFMAGLTLKEAPFWLGFIQNLTYVYMLATGLVVLISFVESLYRIYESLPISDHRNIKGYVQLIKILLFIVVLLIIISVVSRKDLSAIIAGIGAMAAVLLLVFKDILLSLVGSIQLSADKMVKIGDWITMPDRDLDGTVIDITLNTVKVQNFDKTIVTVPTYALVKESFQNWAGMQEAGVRRIKRPIPIDLKSIKFIDENLRQKIYRIGELKQMIEDKENRMEGNKEEKSDDSFFNPWKLTNLGLFRIYAEEYLRRHPMVDRNQTIIVRHREIEGNGLPLQIYAFSSDPGLAAYESLQSEIFEHLLAILGEFELKIYQPTGEDILELTRNRNIINT